MAESRTSSDEYRALLGSLVEAEVEHADLVAAVAENEKKLNGLRARVAAALQGQVAGHEEPSTKAGKLRLAYLRNPWLSPKEAAVAMEGTDDSAAVKRIYALRDYLLKNNVLKKNDDGSYAVLD